MSALRQEGHAFTEQRFYAWFAGLVTLSDAPSRVGLAPRTTCGAILTELTHSSWPPLAEVAASLAGALLAPGDLHTDGAHDAAIQIIARGRNLVEGWHRTQPQSIFASLLRLQDLVLGSTAFAPPEHLLNFPGARQKPSENHRPSLWPIELHAGSYFRAQGWLSPALPLIGLIRPDAMTATDPLTGEALGAESLHRIVLRLQDMFEAAIRHSRRSEQQRVGRRSTSRAPALLDLLAGFGPMRSTQIENVLGATRIGVRGMIATLEADQQIHRVTIAGSHLYSAASVARSAVREASLPDQQSFSNQALDDFDTAMARLDGLLTR